MDGWAHTLAFCSWPLCRESGFAMRRAYLDRSLAMCLLKPSSLPRCVFAMRLRLPNVSSQFVFAYPLCLRNASAPPNARTRACSSVLERTRAYSSVLESTRAYSSVLERTRAYSSVLVRTRAYSSVLERTRAYSSVLVLVRTRAYSSVLERTRAYSSILVRTRAYARVLEVQSPIAAAMQVDFAFNQIPPALEDVLHEHARLLKGVELVGRSLYGRGSPAVAWPAGSRTVIFDQGPLCFVEASARSVG